MEGCDHEQIPEAIRWAAKEKLERSEDQQTKRKIWWNVV